MDGDPLRRARQPLRLAQRHLHQEGAPSGGRQHLALDLLQQRQRLRPLPAPTPGAGGAPGPLQFPPAGQHPLLGYDDSGRPVWLRHRLCDGTTDQVHQSPDPQRVRHSQSLCPDGAGRPVLRGGQEHSLVDEQHDGAGGLLCLHLGQGPGDEEDAGGAPPQGDGEEQHGGVSLSRLRHGPAPGEHAPECSDGVSLDPETVALQT